MILFIRVRAENSVALNFPRRQPGPAKRHVMSGGAVIFELDTTAGQASLVYVCVCVSGFTQHKLHSVCPAAT